MAKLDRFIIDNTTYELVPEIAPLFNPATSYSVGDCVIYDAVLYKFIVNHAAGAWTGNDVEAIEVADRLNKISDSVAPEFSASASYTAGSYVYKNGVLYRFIAAHSGAWTGTDAETVTVGGDVEEVKGVVQEVEENIYEYSEKNPGTTSSGYRLNETDGRCSSNANYKLLKYPVVEGKLIRIVSDDRFQFQSIATVPTSGASNRIGNVTYGKGTYDLVVPTGATYLIVSTPTTSLAKMYSTESVISNMKSDISMLNRNETSFTVSVTLQEARWERSGINSTTGAIGSNSYRIMTTDYIANENLLFIEAKSNDYEFALVAFDGSTYVGIYDGETFIKGSIPWHKKIRFVDLPQNYSYKVCGKKSSGDSVVIYKEDGEFFSFAYEAATSNVLIEKQTSYNLAGISSTDGTNTSYSDSSNLTRIRTAFLDDDIEYVVANEPYLCALYGWDIEGSFLGVFDGSNFVKGKITWIQKINITEIREKNDGYKFKLVLAKTGTATFTSIDDALQHLHIFGHSTIKKITDNLFCNYIQNASLDENGELTRSAGAYTSDYIEIPKRYSMAGYIYDPYHYVVACSVVGTTYSENNFASCCFYDAQKQFISKVTANPINTNQNARFIRVSFASGTLYHFVKFSNSLEAIKYKNSERVVHGSELPFITSRNSDGAITNLLRTASQYLYNNEFGYGNNYTAFSETCEKVESDGKRKTDGTMDSTPLYDGERYQIDCSALTKLVLSCITLKNSRYYNTVNRVPIYGFAFGDDCEYDNAFGRLTANKQARYARQHQWLYAVDTNFINVCVGDLLFMSDNNSADESVFFDGISHSMLVVGITEDIVGDRSIYVVEANDSTQYVVRLTNITSYSAYDRNNKIHYGARFPIPNTSGNIRKTGCVYAEDVALIDGEGLIFSITLDEPISEREIYTLKWKADTDTEASFTIMVGNVSIQNGGYSIDADGNGTIHFFTADYTQTVGKEAVSVEVSGNGSNNIHLEYAEFFRGYVS